MRSISAYNDKITYSIVNVNTLVIKIYNKFEKL